MKKCTLPYIKRVLLLLCLLAFTASALTEDASAYLRFVKIDCFDISLTISPKGRAQCFCEVTVFDSDTINLTMELQYKNSRGNWMSVKSWNLSDQSTVTLDKEWQVSSGYSYRLHATADVYTSSGTLVESEPADSTIVNY